nr:spermidine synthase [Microlunatus panaciterrae]
MGTLTLRRRLDPSLKVEVYEVKLGDEFLMSSLFTVAEVELAHLGLAQVDVEGAAVLVGGLGLGYTAQAALAHPSVGSVTVVDALEAVISWHQRRLLPVSGALMSDPRTRLLHADFFALMRRDPEPGAVGGFDAILVDIDHSPRHLLHPSHADLYTTSGLRQLSRHLAPGGVFALWSDDPPDEWFNANLAEVFAVRDAHVVSFANPLTHGLSANTVYVAKRATGDLGSLGPEGP